jgi:hypothetical protein
VWAWVSMVYLRKKNIKEKLKSWEEMGWIGCAI